MQDPFVYPGTMTLKNRFGVRDEAVVEELEAAAYTNRRTQPVPSFTPDLAGLKAIHRHLFQDIYEWAGTTRAERVTVDGETFTPPAHTLRKGAVAFAHTSLLGRHLEETLLIHRVIIDDAQKDGELTRERWAELTADQVGTINTAHPFNEGNGRTMRRFIELSAEHYGFQARIIGGPEWVVASHNAMIPGHAGELAELISTNSTSSASKDRSSVSLDKPEGAGGAKTKAAGTKAEAGAPATGTAVTTAAAEAVAKIEDPQRRAEAQRLLDGMYDIAALNEPNFQRPPGDRDSGRGFDR